MHELCVTKAENGEREQAGYAEKTLLEQRTGIIERQTSLVIELETNIPPFINLNLGLTKVPFGVL